MAKLSKKIDYTTPTTGIIVAVDSASCVVYLNTKGTKIGRLYKKDSRAFKSNLPFDKIPEYQAGQKITTVTVAAKSQEDNRQLFYLNERWVGKDPWDNLLISNGDEVFGYVSEAIPDFHTPIAYLVQLSDTQTNSSLPDIETFLPIDEIPKLDDTTLQLNFGDTIYGTVISTDERPPYYPKISIKRLRKDYYQKQIESLERARTTFIFLGKDKVKLESKLATPLKGKHLVLIDDEKSAIETFKRSAMKLGASVSAIHWRQSLNEKNIRSQLSTICTHHGIPDAVIIDDTLGKPTTGLALLEKLKRNLIDWNFILASSFFTPETTAKLGASNRKQIAAIHKPVRLASLLEILVRNKTPREFMQGVEAQVEIQELISKAEIALSAAVGDTYKVEILAFSISSTGRLHSISEGGHRLSKEDKAVWANDNYFKILLQKNQGCWK